MMTVGVCHNMNAQVYHMTVRASHMTTRLCYRSMPHDDYLIIGNRHVIRDNYITIDIWNQMEINCSHNNSIFGTSYDIAIAVSELLASLMSHHVNFSIISTILPL